MKINFLLVSIVAFFILGSCKKSSPGNNAGGGGGVSATVPVLSVTTAVTSITNTSAISGGNVNSDGGAAVSVRGVCWNTASNPTIANSKTTDGSGTGSFTSNLTGLNAGVTY